MFGIENSQELDDKSYYKLSAINLKFRVKLRIFPAFVFHAVPTHHNWKALSQEDKGSQNRRFKPCAEVYKRQKILYLCAALPVLASHFFPTMILPGFSLQPHSAPCTPYH